MNDVTLVTLLLTLAVSAAGLFVILKMGLVPTRFARLRFIREAQPIGYTD